jgi:vacuolar-type H+-ATPase subunit I/STV1
MGIFLFIQFSMCFGYLLYSLLHIVLLAYLVLVVLKIYPTGNVVQVLNHQHNSVLLLLQWAVRGESHFCWVSSYKMVRALIRMVINNIFTIAGILFYIMLFGKDSLRDADRRRVNKLGSSHFRQYNIPFSTGEQQTKSSVLSCIFTDIPGNYLNCFGGVCCALLCRYNFNSQSLTALVGFVILSSHLASYYT